MLKIESKQTMCCNGFTKIFLFDLNVIENLWSEAEVNIRC